MRRADFRSVVHDDRLAVLAGQSDGIGTWLRSARFEPSAPLRRTAGGMTLMPTDTSPEAERVLIAGYRRMSPREKLGCVVALNHAVEQLARARLRAQYGADLAEREIRLRLGALRLERRLMIEVFGWDPRERGY